MEGVDVFALMSDEAIGAAIGEKHVKDLAGFMNEKSQDNGTLFAISYDMAKQMEIQAALEEQFQLDMVEEDDGVVNEYADAVQKAYTDILGRSRVDVRLTSDGLQIDNSVTFK